MFDIMIFGGGPAGLTAGIYAARAGLKTVIIEKTSVGGQASITPDIENYPGIDKISGFQLAYKMQSQCVNFGAEFIFDQIKSLDLNGSFKSAETENSGKIEAKTVIIASGASPRFLGVPREKEFVGRGVSYCATCDGAFFRNKRVAVVGGGNTAVEDALYLQKFASEVYLIHRRDQLRAVGLTADKVLSNGVKIIWNSTVTALIGESKLSSVEITNKVSDKKTILPLEGLFVAVGQLPASSAFAGVNTDENGYILTDENLATNIAGVFAAGDVRQKQLRQIVTATADGAIAVDSAMKYLARN